MSAFSGYEETSDERDARQQMEQRWHEMAQVPDDRRKLLDIRKQIHDRMFAAREAYEDELSMNCSNPLSDSLKEEADWLLGQLDELDAHLGLTNLPDRLHNPNQKQPS